MPKKSQLLQFTETCFALATRHVTPHSSKFSRADFTQPQLVALYCLKIKLGTGYRELVDWLVEMPRLQRALGLAKLPQFTTVQKAFAPLSTTIWRVLQQASADEPDDGRIAAIDASGWERSHASRHYTQRTKLKIRALKTTLLVDTRTQTILDVHVTATRKHDTQIGPQVAKRSRKRFDALVADQGYDDRTLRLQLKRDGKRPVIPHREFKPHDAANNARLNNKIYHQRSLVETVISVLKRKYGAAVTSRSWWRQQRELVARCLVPNVERAVQRGVELLLWLASNLLPKGFYGATTA